MVHTYTGGLRKNVFYVSYVRDHYQKREEKNGDCGKVFVRYHLVTFSTKAIQN